MRTAETTPGIAETANIDDIKADLTSLKNDVADLVAGLARTGKDRAREGMHHTTEAMSDLAYRSREGAEKAHEHLAEYVGNKPVTCLAIAFGVGALLGRFMRR